MSCSLMMMINTKFYHFFFKTANKYDEQYYNYDTIIYNKNNNNNQPHHHQKSNDHYLVPKFKKLMNQSIFYKAYHQLLFDDNNNNSSWLNLMIKSNRQIYLYPLFKYAPISYIDMCGSMLNLNLNPFSSFDLQSNVVLLLYRKPEFRSSSNIQRSSSSLKLALNTSWFNPLISGRLISSQTNGRWYRLDGQIQFDAYHYDKHENLPWIGHKVRITSKVNGVFQIGKSIQVGAAFRLQNLQNLYSYHCYHHLYHQLICDGLVFRYNHYEPKSKLIFTMKLSDNKNIFEKQFFKPLSLNCTIGLYNQKRNLVIQGFELNVPLKEMSKHHLPTLTFGVAKSWNNRTSMMISSNEKKNSDNNHLIRSFINSQGLIGMSYSWRIEISRSESSSSLSGNITATISGLFDISNGKMKFGFGIKY